MARDRMKYRWARAARPAVAVLVAATLSPPAQAHLVETGLGPVYDGIAHFALTPEDLIPALMLAVLAGLRGKEHARRAIFVLPLAWLLAGLVGSGTRIALPGAFAWLPLLILGALVAADFRLSASATAAIAIVIGAFLGLANGAAMAGAGAGMRGVLGIVGAVFVVSTLAAGAVVAWQAGWLRIAWRVAGSWIAACGLLLMGWSLR
jgi:hydrogenase/urease accessory protein HupE